MTRTARRRWSRELETEVDGIAIAGDGPLLIHGYEAPAGGKWIDDVIPGKLRTLDRSTGEMLWSGPCEVGYGRGFGAGIGGHNDVIVLGPSLQGHRIVRMSLETGELLELSEIPPFDFAVVAADLCVCVTPGRVFAVLVDEMSEVWEYSRKGQRFHLIAREGNAVHVVYTDEKAGAQGVLSIDVQTGRVIGTLLEPRPTVIHAIAAQPGSVVLLVDRLQEVLDREQLFAYLTARIAEDPDAEVEDPSGLALLALAPGDSGAGRSLWFETLGGDDASGELPEVTIQADSDRLYAANGAVLSVRDCLTGRDLGSMTVPGLDEHIAWRVAQGAGLLAEETRVSVFEVPD
jgi:hypothetical protein